MTRDSSLACIAWALWLVAATSCTSVAPQASEAEIALDQRWSEFEQEVSATADTGTQEHDPQEGAEEGTQWSFELRPYLWVPAMRGSATVEGITFPVSLNQSEAFDLLKDLDSAFVLHSELGIDNFSLFGDLYYLNLEGSQSTNLGRFNIEFKQAMFELGAAYKVIDEDFGDGLGFAAAPLVGARAYYMDTKISRPIVGTNSGDEAWVDGFGGVRFRLGARDGLAVVGRFDAGAGGSRASWNALAGVEWSIASFLALTGGYRWLSVDYSSGSGTNRFEYDVMQLGPYFGLSFRF